jgi:hypothetical protein
MPVKRFNGECECVEGRVVLNDEDGAFSGFERGKKVEMRGFKDVAQSPASSPFQR